MKSRSVLGGLRSNNPAVSRAGYSVGRATQGRVRRGPANTVGRMQRGVGGYVRNARAGRIR